MTTTVDGTVTVAASSMTEVEIDVEVDVVEAKTTMVEVGAVMVMDVVAVTVLFDAGQLDVRRAYFVLVLCSGSGTHTGQGVTVVVWNREQSAVADEGNGEALVALTARKQLSVRRLSVYLHSVRTPSSVHTCIASSALEELEARGCNGRTDEKRQGELHVGQHIA